MTTMTSLCTDCGVETLPVDDQRAEWYMVTPDVWAQSGMPYQGFLCIGCLESRLGRRLVPADFTDCPLNNLGCVDMQRYAWSWRTQRLTARIKG